MMDSPKHLWPLVRVDEALSLLARRHGLAKNAIEIPAMPEDWAEDRHKLARWLETTASVLGLETESIVTNYAEVDQLIDRAGPAIFRVSHQGNHHLLVLLKSHRDKAIVLGSDHCAHRLARAEIRRLLCEHIEAPLRAEIEQLLREVGVPEHHKGKARQALLRERLSDAWIGGSWLIRLPLTHSLWQHARAAGLPSRMALFLGAYLIYYALWLSSWWLVGKGALQGRFDLGWMLAWALILFTLIPFRMLAKWLEGVTATGLGAILKQKLLFGALQFHPDRIRHQGHGQLFSRAADAEVLERFSLNSSFFALLGGIEILLAMLVLAVGPAGPLHLPLLLAWLGVTLFIGWRFLRARIRWTDQRLTLTQNLVERMVGYRTRLAQEPREHWHGVEDQELESYFEHTKNMDQIGMVPIALSPRGWMILGLLGLAPSFIAGQTFTASLAVGFGGILLAYQGLQKLVGSLAYLTGARIAWGQLKAFLQAASHSHARQTFAALTTFEENSAPQQELLVQAKDLFFRYRENGKAVLENYHLQIKPGERILLQGPSGGGKSTLASVLTGLREPNSGLLLLRGLDWQTLGSEGWRRRIVSAPQFHENHVLTGTFAFNLLMGRGWPATPEDLHEAEALCYELDLGELLQKMPAGLMQMVGETGWQLSHGERSRLYMARALLQNADLIILDESFAALDPENLQTAMQCAITRAKTLMVIAHP